MRRRRKSLREAIMRKLKWGISLAVLVAALGTVEDARTQTGSTGLTTDGRIGVSAAVALADIHI